MAKVSLAQQLEEVQLTLKEDYPYLKGRPSVVEFRINRMRAIAHTLAWLIEHEEMVKGVAAAVRLSKEDPELIKTALTEIMEKGRVTA